MAYSKKRPSVNVINLPGMLKIILSDTIMRSRAMLLPVFRLPLLLAAGIPKSEASFTSEFQPVPTLNPEQAASVNDESGDLVMSIWTLRGNRIRSGDTLSQCLSNLTVALEQVGQLNAAEYNGASGAMSLLPTAGALLGAPSKEMWIVYKLIPLAGILSMFLSLGATIAPDNATDFDPEKKTLYGGLMPTISDNSHLRSQLDWAKTTIPATGLSTAAVESSASVKMSTTPAQMFAKRVMGRAAESDTGGVFSGRIWIGIATQVSLIIIILVPMWYAQQGSVVTWWCRSWGWMWFWYFLVVVVSIGESLLAAPFSKSWTIRVSQKPLGISVSTTAHKITDRSRHPNALEYIKKGVNTRHRITIGSLQPSVYNKMCFYVVISVEGVTRWHAIMKTVSKSCSVAVFAFGTALFASSTLMSISVALMCLSLILISGVFGRVIVMWIAAEMNREAKPILHAVVQDSREADEYFHAIAELPLQIEIGGNIILDGVPLFSRHLLFSPETYIGLLAKPYNLVAKAERSSRGALSTSSPPNNTLYFRPTYDGGPASGAVSRLEDIELQQPMHHSYGPYSGETS
ncbi:hypothetical protein MGN70_011473 [Eutypa lata]|nr:hypothetical protein MGN70_011473 [Eutypa lata]